MKLKYAFEIVDMGDEYIAVPIGQNANQMGGVLRLNKSGLEVLDYLSNDIVQDKIIDKLCDKYDDSRETLENIVRDTIIKLKDMGLILEDK